MNSKEYLRYLQKEAGIKPYNIEKLKTHYNLRYNKERIDKVYEKFIDVNNPLISLENFINKVIVEPFFKILTDEEKKILSNVYVGFLPTYNPNAMAISVPNSYPLIILHTELLAALSYYNEYQLVSYKIMEEGVINQVIDEICKGYKVVVECFIESDKPSIPLIPPVLSKEMFEFSNMKTLAQDLFIIAHEFAHIYLGHLDDSSKFSFPRINVNKVNCDQRMEFEADLQALKWLSRIRVGQGFYYRDVLDEYFLVFSIEVFMMFHLIEANTSIPNDDSTHPSAVKRLTYLLQEGEQYFSNRNKKLLKDMIMHASENLGFKVM